MVTKTLVMATVAIPSQLVVSTVHYQICFTRNVIGRSKIKYLENAYMSNILLKNDEKPATSHWVETMG